MNPTLTGGGGLFFITQSHSMIIWVLISRKGMRFFFPLKPGNHWLIIGLLLFSTDFEFFFFGAVRNAERWLKMNQTEMNFIDMMVALYNDKHGISNSAHVLLHQVGEKTVGSPESIDLFLKIS